MNAIVIRIGNRVDVMKEARNQEQAAAKAKAQRVSPELNEFLHLLNSLESQFSAEAPQTASRAS